MSTVIFEIVRVEVPCSATMCDLCVHLRRCARANALALAVTARSRANMRTHTETRVRGFHAEPRNARCVAPKQ